MQYNIKLKEYKDSATLIIYSDLVGISDDITINHTKNKKEKDAIKYDINPFTGEKYVIEETDEEKFYRKQEYLAKSLTRTKKTIRELIRAGAPWDYFITLTLAPNKIDRMDYNLCTSKVRKWFQNLRRIEGAGNMRFLCVPEEHKDGAWHFHALIADAEKIKLTDSGHTTKQGQRIYNLDGWHLGFSTAIEVGQDAEDSIRLATYVTKYLTKHSITLIGRHRYFASNNIPKTRETKLIYEGQDDLQTLYSNILYKYDTVSSSHFLGDYVDLDYIELKKKTYE